MIETVFRGATIHDGLGSAPRRGDVAIADGRIVAPDRDATGRGTRIIDADGLIVAPGFIDLHSHGDCTLPAFPGAINSISQGVTTEVIGNCGYSPAPVSPIAERANELASPDPGDRAGPRLVVVDVRVVPRTARRRPAGSQRHPAGRLRRASDRRHGDGLEAGDRG